MNAIPANDTGLPGLPGEAAMTETPIIRLFREWEALYAYLDGPVGRELSEDEFDAELDRRIAIEDRMMEIPSEGPADFVAKVIAYTTRGESGLPDHQSNPAFWAEARALIAV